MKYGVTKRASGLFAPYHIQAAGALRHLPDMTVEEMSERMMRGEYDRDEVLNTLKVIARRLANLDANTAEVMNIRTMVVNQIKRTDPAYYGMGEPLASLSGR